ncbi:hypothetical protein HanIR_Chr06g0297331 [Helianthus annuus]|nr:hypothetical protein HanIR_Chr06g0297331 [Helianthus annuus]
MEVNVFLLLYLCKCRDETWWLLQYREKDVGMMMVVMSQLVHISFCFQIYMKKDYLLSVRMMLGSDVYCFINKKDVKYIWDEKRLKCPSYEAHVTRI